MKKTKAKVRLREPNAIERKINIVVVRCPHIKDEGSLVSKCDAIESPDLDAANIYTWLMNHISAKTFERLQTIFIDRSNE